MGEVIISGQTSLVYGTQAGAKVYLAGNILGGPFVSASSDVQKQALLTATRWVDRIGLKDPDTDAEINPTSDDSGVPADVITGVYELALAIATKPAIVNAANTGSNIKKAGAGSAAVEFFRPTKGKPLPEVALGFLSDYLCIEDAGIGYGAASGSDACSSFDGNNGGLTDGYA